MRQLCAFYVADELFGLDIAHVIRIIPAPPISTVPLASPMFRGLLHWRNQMIVVVNIHHALGLASPHDTTSGFLLLLESPQGLWGMIVDAVDDVINVTEDSAQTLAALPALVDCTYPVKQGVLMLLNYHVLTQWVE